MNFKQYSSSFRKSILSKITLHDDQKGSVSVSSILEIVVIALLLVGVLTFVSYKVSYSFFNDSSDSTGNVLSAAEVFPSLTPTITPTPHIANHIVISEVQITGGSGSTNNDFIELYNPTSSPINLSADGYRLVRRSGSSSTDSLIISFGSTHIIPAHGFLLWANNGLAASINADASSAAILASSNSIALRQGISGPIVDALSWNSAVESFKEGTEFSPDPTANQSMERKASGSSTAVSLGIGGLEELKGNGFDSNNNVTDFILRSTSQPQNSSSAPEVP